jgi:hypothetical protein
VPFFAAFPTKKKGMRDSFRATGLLGSLPQELVEDTIRRCEECVDVRIRLCEQRESGDYSIMTPIPREELKSCEVSVVIPPRDRRFFAADSLTLLRLDALFEGQRIPKGWIQALTADMPNLPLFFKVRWGPSLQDNGSRTLADRQREWEEAGNGHAQSSPFPTKAADLLGRIAGVVHAMLKKPELFRIAEVRPPESWVRLIASGFRGQASVRLCAIPHELRRIDRSTRWVGMADGRYGA